MPDLKFNKPAFLAQLAATAADCLDMFKRNVDLLLQEATAAAEQRAAFGMPTGSPTEGPPMPALDDLATCIVMPLEHAHLADLSPAYVAVELLNQRFHARMAHPPGPGRYQLVLFLRRVGDMVPYPADRVGHADR